MKKELTDKLNQLTRKSQFVRAMPKNYSKSRRCKDDVRKEKVRQVNQCYANSVFDSSILNLCL